MKLLTDEQTDRQSEDQGHNIISLLKHIKMITIQWQD